MSLWHYTCSHGHTALGEQGLLVPNARGPVGVVWLTDLDHPIRDALGLTSRVLSCDRTTHRYRIDDPPPEAAWWPTVRRTWPARVVHALETAPGAMPAHWWVSPVPVHAVHDPIRQGAPV